MELHAPKQRTPRRRDFNRATDWHSLAPFGIDRHVNVVARGMFVFPMGDSLESRAPVARCYVFHQRWGKIAIGPVTVCKATTQRSIYPTHKKHAVLWQRLLVRQTANKLICTH
ncbi:hypothetical protein LZ32DRAFT_375286 [Colletotrichum eremochloae]|nr:hypothetical protein LZ32DRAFT_375286 [Colletotrichum eremochloae]